LDSDRDEDAPPPFTFQKAAIATFNVIVQNNASMMPVGKDLPRLMGKMTINGQKISPQLSELGDRLQEIIGLLYDSLTPVGANDRKQISTQLSQPIVAVPPTQQCSNSSLSVVMSDHGDAFYGDKKRIMKSFFENCHQNDVENHEWLQRVIIDTFTEDHALFQVLRACNQSAIAQSVIFLKQMIQNKCQKEYKDKDWLINVQVKDEPAQDGWTKQTVTVTHNRGERVMHKMEQEHQLLQWFLFRWSVIFTFQRRFNMYSVDMVPLDFVSVRLVYNGAEEYNSKIRASKTDQERFGSLERIDRYFGLLFQKFAKEYRYVQNED